MGQGDTVVGERFEERRARAAALPPTYIKGSAQWLSTIIERDLGARYFGFDFWSLAAWGRSEVELPKVIRRACGATSCDLFPTLNPSSTNRSPLDMCVAAMLLPAQKEHGVYHLHGFMRVPPAAVNTPLVALIVETQGRGVAIKAPIALKHFSGHLRRFSGGSSSSLHFDHDEGVSPVAIDMAVNVARRSEKLTYLTQPGPEVRGWDATEFVPSRFWKRLVKAWAKDSATDDLDDEVLV
jgi:hypothetical protein